jgi:allantoin racemase
MKKDIRIISPITTKGLRTLEDVAPFVREDLSFSQVDLDVGPPSVECEFDEVLCMPDTVRKAIEAERDGAHAIVVDCMGDPAVRACREVVRIPVVGPCETSMHIASMLGQRFAVVTTMDASKPLFFNAARLYGLSDRMTRVRAVNVPVLDIASDAARLFTRMAEESLKAVLEDDADVIVFGCTGFCGGADAIRTHLRERLGREIPVIDPIPACVLFASTLVEAGLTHSEKTYPAPAPKQNIGYDMPPLRRVSSGVAA